MRVADVHTVEEMSVLFIPATGWTVGTLSSVVSVKDVSNRKTMLDPTKIEAQLEGILCVCVSVCV